MSDSLYIIGNGFDLAHATLPGAKERGLYKTRYSDYRDFLIDKCQSFSNEKGSACDICNKMGTCFIRLILDSVPMNGTNWSHLEESLADIPAKSIKNVVNELKLRHPNQFNCFSCFLDEYNGALQYSLTEWVNSIKIDDESRYRFYDLETNAFFITFNYTLTLEKIYGIPGAKIHHIHGKNMEYIYDGCDEKLILGHGKTREEVFSEPQFKDYLEDADLGDVRDVLYSWRKNYEQIISEIKNNTELFEKITSCTTVKIIGHSLSLVDKPYFDWLSDVLPKDARWIRYCYDLRKRPFDLLKETQLINPKIELRSEDSIRLIKD